MLDHFHKYLTPVHMIKQSNVIPKAQGNIVLDPSCRVNWVFLSAV